MQLRLHSKQNENTFLTYQIQNELNGVMAMDPWCLKGGEILFSIGPEYYYYEVLLLNIQELNKLLQKNKQNIIISFRLFNSYSPTYMGYCQRQTGR